MTCKVENVKNGWKYTLNRTPNDRSYKTVPYFIITVKPHWYGHWRGHRKCLYNGGVHIKQVLLVKNTLFLSKYYSITPNIFKHHQALILQTVSMKTHGSLEKIDQKLSKIYQLDWCQNGLLLLCTIHSFWCTMMLGTWTWRQLSERFFYPTKKEVDYSTQWTIKCAD